MKLPRFLAFEGRVGYDNFHRTRIVVYINGEPRWIKWTKYLLNEYLLDAQKV